MAIVLMLPGKKPKRPYNQKTLIMASLSWLNTIGHYRFIEIETLVRVIRLLTLTSACNGGILIILLPQKNVIFKEHEKLNTYLKLAEIGCPVLKSVLFDNNDLNNENISSIIEYLGSEFCTIRYQYTKSTPKPARGGNRVKISYEELVSQVLPDTMLWLLEPVNRLTNKYGINLFFNRNNETLIFECVGKGFDTSNINRGDMNPHQIIEFGLPIEFGWDIDWWKYARFQFISDFRFQESKLIRLRKLRDLGIKTDGNIFTEHYEPLSLLEIEKLMTFSEKIYTLLFNEKEFVVSCSIDENNKLIFWDSATPSGKIKILGI